MNVIPPGGRRAVFLIMAALLFPLCYAGVSSALQIVMANKAHAATKATIDESSVVMTESSAGTKRKIYGRALTGLVNSDPDLLLRLVAQDVLLVLDEPELKREEPLKQENMSARVWQYRTENCVLDVYFGAAPQAGDAPVVHYELRRRDKATLTQKPETKPFFDEQGCLKELL